MALKLKWEDDRLMLGRLPLARIGRVADLGWHYAIPDAEAGVHGPYEEPSDAQQDCEVAVRRMLREAGAVL